MGQASRTRRGRSRRPQVGASPGTLVVATEKRTKPIRVIHYDESHCDEHTVDTVAQCAAFLQKPGRVWFDIDDAPDVATLEGFRDLLKLHPLAVADAANVPQRPKFESYDTFDLVILRMVMLQKGAPSGPAKIGSERIAAEQISMFFNERWVLTIQERPGDCLDPVRERLRQAAGRLRTLGTDYLAYAITDAVIDGYFPVAEAMGDLLEDLEVEVLGKTSRTVVARLYEVRRDLLLLRRALWPMREALNLVMREGVGRFRPETRPYLRDVYDHAVQLMDMTENLRELASGLVELHLSAVGFRTNEVMRVLTVISTIFLPLTFIAGVYGMNFDTSSPANMPELRWRYGYAFSLALMAACALGMVIFFRRRGWLGGGGSETDLQEVAKVAERQR